MKRANVRSDKVMYELPPDRTGKRVRPRKHGDKIVNFKGSRKVLTNIFGDRVVTANLCNIEKYQKLSSQQVRFHISEIVRANVFFDSLALRAQTLIKSNRLYKS